MGRIPKLLEGLRSILRRRGLSYADLARRLQVSESTVKRMFSRGVVSVSRLEEVCRLVDIDFLDLAKECNARDSGSAMLSSEQEHALTDDPILLAVFHLLLNDWAPERIEACYLIEKAQMISLLAKLDRVGLIELKPHNVIRLRVSPRLSWGRQKEVRARYERTVREEFLSAPFDRPDDVLRFDVRELTPASIAALQEKIESLAIELQELAGRDANEPTDRKVSVGCLVAARPWVFSVLTALRRREALT